MFVSNNTKFKDTFPIFKKMYPILAKNHTNSSPLVKKSPNKQNYVGAYPHVTATKSHVQKVCLQISLHLPFTMPIT